LLSYDMHAYYSVKRDLLQCQKKPTTVSTETYYSVKRDLKWCPNRPSTVSKETCVIGGAVIEDDRRQLLYTCRCHVLIYGLVSLSLAAL